jgi:molybdate transport system substrate-binding protein
VAVGSLGLVALLSLVLWAPWSRPSIDRTEELTLYCPAGMLRPVEATVNEYQREYGVSIRLEIGGSGQLLSRIRAIPNRGDLYLAADTSYIEIAQREGLVAESIPVARMHPVVVVNRATQQRLTEQGHPVTGLDDLLRDDLQVVLANPELASVGRVTQQLLTASGHWDELEARLSSSAGAQVSTVGTVTEVAQAVRVRDGMIGVVWDVEARQHAELVTVTIAEWEEEEEYVTIGVLTGTPQRRVPSALQFARYLSARDRGLRHFEQFHFRPVEDADVWKIRPELTLMSGAMLKPGVEQILADFEKREGVSITTNYNGCGILVAQMESLKRGGEGTFPDAYFSCDMKFMAMVADWFEAATTVSRNDMVIAVQPGNPLEIRSLEDLTRRDVRVGLAHPVNSALGNLTDDLLKRIGLHDRLYDEGWQDHVVHTDAGHDLVNKLRVRALDAAVVYQSNVRAIPVSDQERPEIVPIDIAGAMAEQPFAVSHDSEHKYLMRRLLRAIVTPSSAERFQQLGFAWVHEGDHD